MRNVLDALVGLIGLDYPAAEDAVERLDRAGWGIVDRLIETRPGHYEDVHRLSDAQWDDEDAATSGWYIIASGMKEQQ